MKQHTIRLLANGTSLLLLTAIIIVLLILDGLIPDLPSYDLKAQNSFEIYLFFSIVVFMSIASQVLFLELIRKKYLRNISTRKHVKQTHFIVSLIQYFVIALTLVVLIQIGILKEYNSFIVAASALLSLFLSIGVTSLLAFRFLAWLKYNRDLIIAAYAVATITISANSVVLATAICFEIPNARSIIDSSRIATSTANITSFELKEFESNLAMISFVALWLASTFLLRRSRTKWRPVKFYLIVTLPLLYYFGVIQLLFSQLLIQYDVLNAVQDYTFNIINSFLARPVGGILFGFAFWVVSRGIENKNIRNYMKLSSFGIMLLSIASGDTGLFMLNYPPFGLSSITFIGVSSYLLFVGVYYSAISVSLDQRLRSSIHKSVEQQLGFVSKIGTSQVEQEIQQRVEHLTRKLAKKMEIESGLEVPMKDEEVDQYIKMVIAEKERISRKKNNSSDEETSST
jgi:hypothetical protein